MRNKIVLIAFLIAFCVLFAGEFVSATVPNAPKDFVLDKVYGTALVFSCKDNSNNEERYEIFRATSAAGPYNLVNTVHGTFDGIIRFAADTGLNPSTTYYYRIRACNVDGCSANLTGNGTTAATLQIPAAPTNFSITARTSTSLTLSWLDNSNNEDYFEVFRAIQSEGNYYYFRGITRNPSITDAVCTPSTTYYYRIRACNVDGCSANLTGNGTTAATLQIPAAPSNLKGRAISGRVVSLNWTDNADNENGFYIEVFNSSGLVRIDYRFWPEDGVGSTAYWDVSGLNPLTTYTFRVKAYNDDGNSSYSNNVTITTPLYMITINKVGSGTITSTDGKINCGSICSVSYTQFNPSQIILTTTPGPQRILLRWEGCDSIDASNRCILNINAPNDRTVEVHFAFAPGAAITSCDDSLIELPGKYTLANDLFNYNPKDACLKIDSDNVILDGNGKRIVDLSDHSVYGWPDAIDFSYYIDYEINNITIKNLTIVNFTYDLYVNRGINGFYLYDIKSKGSVWGSYFYNINNMYINNFIATNANDDGIYLQYSRNNVFTDINLNGIDDISNDGILIVDSSTNNTFYNIIITQAKPIGQVDKVVYFTNDAKNNYLVNASYDVSREAVNNNAILIRKWYFDGNVSDSSTGQAIPLANIEGRNSFGEVQFSTLSDASGKIPRQEVIDYINDNGVKYSYNPYTINVSKTGYVPNTFSLTFDKNNYLDVKLTSTGSNVYHQADTNRDRKISSSEISYYNMCYQKAGCTINGQSITIANLTSANSIWQGSATGAY